MSGGLAWLAIALLCCDDGSRRRRALLALVSALLPLTHPYQLVAHSGAFQLCRREGPLPAVLRAK